MAEGGAEDVVLGNQNGSFQRKLQLASEAPGASVETVSVWARALNKRKSPRGNRTTGITAHQQAEKRRKRSKQMHPRNNWMPCLNSCLILLTPMHNTWS